MMFFRNFYLFSHRQTSAFYTTVGPVNFNLMFFRIICKCCCIFFIMCHIYLELPAFYIHKFYRHVNHPAIDTIQSTSVR